MNNEIYRCTECGMAYATAEIAQRCEQWCQEHHSCNIDIIKNALPNDKVNQ